MRFASLDQWLAWLEALHPREIELGLARVRQVWNRLGAPAPAPHVVTVGGTNGKGSSVALLEAILTAAGWRVGAYTSPHLLRYNERARVAGEEVDDGLLCEAFARIDAARGDISLTYFEFGTLAALDVFARADLDVALLEVGMGGRLDAVNIIDADVAVVTAVDLDHQAWLGSDREAIGYEKAGIFRPARPAVISDPGPPASLIAQARAVGSPLFRLGHEFHYDRPREGAVWHWRSAGQHLDNLPLPALAGDWQLQNAAGALMALEWLGPVLPVDRAAIERGLRTVRMPGRCQRFLIDGVSWMVDVAHNPHAAAALADLLRREAVPGKTHAICAVLADKDAAGICRAMAPVVDVWHIAGLEVARGAPPAVLEEALASAGVAAPQVHESVESACAAAAAGAGSGDRIVVFGSFHTAASVVPLLAAGGFGVQSDSP